MMDSWLVWTVLVTCVCYLIKLCYNKLIYWKERGIPHGFDIPFVHGIGTLIIWKKSFPDIINSMYYRFPGARYYGTFNMNKPSIVLRDIEIIREVCVKSFDGFTDHVSVVDASTDPVFARNILLLKGDRWKEMRRTLSPSFTANKMKFMFHLVAECSKNFVAYYKQHSYETYEINMKNALTRYTNDVIATAAFGVSVDSLKYPENEFFLHGKGLNDSNKFLLMIKFITLALCPALSRLMGITILPEKTNAFFKKLIVDAVNIRDEKGMVRPDMIQLLMQARDVEGIEMTTEDIVSQAVIFFLGGFETTSTLMCYLTYELGYNPEIQEKLRAEVDEYLPSGEELTYDKLNKMKYIDMVINETLRKYPPLSLLDRVCTRPSKLPPALHGYAEYNIEVGTIVNIPVYAIHHDPALFPDPEKFDPERFSEENKDRIDPCSYLPFGIGPRMCIASRFALMETKILFAHILQNFIIKPLDKTPYPVIFAPSAFQILARGGIWNKFEERKKYN